MSEAATDDCEGCDEERPVQQLQEVRLPTGQTVLCCPDCRYHAEKLAAGSTQTCDGCGTDVAVGDLEATPLTDGRKLDLCAACVEEASTIYETEQSNWTSTGRNGDGTGDTGTRTTDAAGTGPAAAAGTTDGSDAETSTAAGADASASTGSAAASAGTNSAEKEDADEAEEADGAASTADAGRTGKPATTDNVCDQCGELFSIELYKVKTVDGRTEEFCPDCKEEGVHEGIVRDVELRRAQAYEVLELDGSASQDEIRQAYLRRVKEVHPDRTDGNRSEFMLVQEAYDRLDEE